MCGIAGIVEYGAVESTISPVLLQKMSDVIAHRGPDDEGHWLQPSRDGILPPKAGFAFRRLAIVDLSHNAHQPMSTPDGRFTIVFNGEIYNHLELRRHLQAKGYEYRSQSDTETILYGYAEWGEDVLSKMIGMWGLAIWDNDKDELFCARDRIGIKPFYYTQQAGRFLFASEIKSILQHPSFSAEINRLELVNYLGISMTGCNTLFAGIHKLRAGHWLKLKRDGTKEICQYWNVLDTALGTNSSSMSSSKQEWKRLSVPMKREAEQEVLCEIMRLLRQAVKDRMMSDVPFGVFLSGGIDSSVNVALMAELMDRPVDTFSVGFKEHEMSTQASTQASRYAKYNEMHYARRIAEIFSTRHHEILIDHNDALGVLEQLVWHEDEPNGDPVCIPLNFVSKLARDSGTIVVQVGEGSDEQFAGYGWMHRDLRFYHTLWRWYRWMPSTVRQALYNAVKPVFVHQQHYLALDYLRRASGNEEFYRGGAVDLTPVHLEHLFSKQFQCQIQSDIADMLRHDEMHQEMYHHRVNGDAGSFAHCIGQIPAKFARHIHREIASRSANADYLQHMVYTEFAHRLPELLLMRVDKITMAHGIEARVPFLDHRLVQYTMTLPESMKIPRYASQGGETKYLLKKAVESLLPTDIIYRKKQGFAAPVSEWFRGALKNYWLSEALESPIVGDNGIFNRAALLQMFDTHVSGKRDFGKSLYAILNLALWHKRFLQ
jgi:asparagine synthase (glutamine-hydrolysing)